MTGQGLLVMDVLLVAMDALILAFIGGWGLRLERRLKRIQEQLRERA